MKILGIDCSAGPASVAVCENKKVISSAFTNVKVTHSQTLMPMLTSVLKSANLTLSDIEGFAISAGPGSFTGIRIGIAAVKGLAAAKNIPCVPVSTLYGMAYSFIGTSSTVCCVMDARCNQVYNALFKVEGNTVTRLCEDRALMCDELISELERINETVTVCGDGADMFCEKAKCLTNIVKAEEHLKYQNAVAVALCAEKDFSNGKTVPANKLLPVYLRLPQAERELKNKRE